MPIHFTIDHDKRHVEAQAKGETGLEDVENFLDAVVLQGALPYRKLFDAREAQPQLSDDDVMVLGARVSAYAEMEPRGPIATIAPPGAAADVIRRFMNLGGAARAIRLFDSIDEARKWLAEQPET